MTQGLRFDFHHRQDLLFSKASREGSDVDPDSYAGGKEGMLHGVKL
jgi:hypothetical protein